MSIFFLCYRSRLFCTNKSTVLRLHKGFPDQNQFSFAITSDLQELQKATSQFSHLSIKRANVITADPLRFNCLITSYLWRYCNRQLIKTAKAIETGYLKPLTTLQTKKIKNGEITRSCKKRRRHFKLLPFLFTGTRDDVATEIETTHVFCTNATHSTDAELDFDIL